jgi:hypothetical protein
MQIPLPQQPSGDAWAAVIDAARKAAESDGSVTEAERLIVEQITTLVQKIKAGREKEQQAALGGGPATQFLRRASAG